MLGVALAWATPSYSGLRRHEPCPGGLTDHCTPSKAATRRPREAQTCVSIRTQSRREENIAYVKSPLFKEERYQAEIPDTLDLAERAGLALGGLTQTADPGDGYMQYFQVYLSTRPPYTQATALLVWYSTIKTVASSLRSSE